MMLDSISISNEENYSFHYNKQSYLPQYVLFDNVDDHYWASDYWGYYNGKLNNFPIDKIVLEQELNIWGLSDKFQKDIARAADKEPTELYAKNGILTKIVYPTGGSSQFEYELNRMDYSLGGLRVKRIINDNHNGNVTTMEYQYRNGYATQVHPRKTMRYLSAHHYIDTNLSGGTISTFSTCISAPVIPLGDNSGNSVFYTEVIESISDFGEIEYLYEDGNLLNFRDTVNADYPQFSLGSFHDEGYSCPSLKCKNVYDEDKNLVYTEQYIYETKESRTFEIGNILLSFLTKGWVEGTALPLTKENICSPYIQTASITGHVKTHVLKRKVVTDYITGVTTAEEYTYDNGFKNMNPKSVSSIGSDGNSYRTEYDYAFDRNDPVSRSMANDYNMLDQIVCERKFCNDILLSTWQTDYAYKQETDWYYPEYVKASLQGEELEEIYHFAEYDNCGNLLTQVDNAVDTTAIVWGYNSSLPVAKVTGCSYSSLKKIPGMSALLENIAECSDSDQMKNYLSVLRSLVGNGRQVTTYLHRPLFGPSAITNESGYTRYYNYRSDGKLSDIRDDEGVIQTFEYNYTNPVIE